MQDNVFNYAKNQVLGLSFEPFTYACCGYRYEWNSWVSLLCRFLMWAGMEQTAKVIFVRFVRSVYGN